MTTTSKLLLFFILSAGSGCTNAAIVDDVEPDLNFFVPFIPPSNSMHSPYVIGAKVGVYAQSTDPNVDMRKWSFESSNENVFSITPPSTPVEKGQWLQVSCAAQTAGSTVITLRDGEGHELTKETIEVKVPDGAIILAHGPLMLGQSDSAATVTQPQIVAGGTATFLVRWTAGGVELSGNGVLSTSSDAVTAVAKTSEFEVHRDWVELTAPSTPGPQSVELIADGFQVTSLPITVVPASDIANISLDGQSEVSVSNGTMLVIIAKAVDSGGTPIFGVDYTFDIDGQTQDGTGDLFRYQFELDSPQTLTAHQGNLTASAMIHSGGGTVGSTNDVGCNSGGMLGALQAIVSVGLFAARRRRTAMKA